jgi:hypothetical protein
MYCDLNNIPFYIGKGKDDRYKVEHHLYKGSSIFLKRKIRKVGVNNVQIQFLHENLTEEEAFQQEKYWIRYYGRRDLKAGTLCNLTDGGDGPSGVIRTVAHNLAISVANKGNQYSKGRKHTEEAKHKISNAFKGKSLSDGHKRNVSNALKGRVFSEEHRRNLSKAAVGKPGTNMGKKFSSDHRRKISEALRGKMSEVTKRSWAARKLAQGGT